MPTVLTTTYIEQKQQLFNDAIHTITLITNYMLNWKILIHPSYGHIHSVCHLNSGSSVWQ